MQFQETVLTLPEKLDDYVQDKQFIFKIKINIFLLNPRRVWRRGTRVEFNN